MEPVVPEADAVESKYGTVGLKMLPSPTMLEARRLASPDQIHFGSLRLSGPRHSFRRSPLLAEPGCLLRPPALFSDH